jgi:hypothetical protein
VQVCEIEWRESRESGAQLGGAMAAGSPLALQYHAEKLEDEGTKCEV